VRYWWENQKGRDRYKDPDVCVDTIKMDFGEIEWVVADWFDLALDKDQWKASMNMVWNLCVP
jgi:hypothetical protein